MTPPVHPSHAAAFIVSVLVLLLAFFRTACGQALALPPRPANAPVGSALSTMLDSLSLEQREAFIEAEILRGNVPPFERHLVPVTTADTVSGRVVSVTLFATPDYLAIGSDDDHVLMPMTPGCAQRIATALGCLLPTTKVVDLLYRQAEVKLRPQPIPPGPAMVTVPVFVQHNDSVRLQRAATLAAHPLGALVAGHKKDVVISNAMRHGLKNGPGRPVVIYGWHRPDGKPIQPLYNGHGERYADYSHGIRLVLDSIVVNGRPSTMTALLRDTLNARLLSNEGVIPEPFYRTDTTTIIPTGR
jgi:hypothetical protein